MLPPAPGLFSTTICWPHISERRAPIMRPTASMPPPGVNGTTSLTMRFGQAALPCAWAMRDAKGAKAGARTAAPAHATSLRRSSMMLSLGLDARGLDHRAPEIDFGLERSCELGRRRAHDRHAGLFQGADDGRLAQDCDRVGMKLAHDLGRRPGGREEGIPGRDVEPRHAGF